MTKTRIVNGILSGMLALYAVFIFVVTKYPRLTNFNDSFYFINWWALPLLTILLLISWIVTFKHDSSFFCFQVHIYRSRQSLGNAMDFVFL